MIANTTIYDTMKTSSAPSDRCHRWSHAFRTPRWSGGNIQIFSMRETSLWKWMWRSLNQSWFSLFLPSDGLVTKWCAYFGQNWRPWRWNCGNMRIKTVPCCSLKSRAHGEKWQEELRNSSLLDSIYMAVTIDNQMVYCWMSIGWWCIMLGFGCYTVSE